MKKAYIKPQTVSITLFPESVIAMSFGGDETDEVWTKKKDNSSSIWGSNQEEEKGSIW